MVKGFLRFWVSIAAIMVVFVCIDGVRAQDNQGDGAAMFFQTLNDVPLMPGLYEIVGESVVFDQPSGRISETKAIAESVKDVDIYRFYNETLPQLGWQKSTSGAFVRENEKLMIEIENFEGYNVISISVSPK